MPLYHLVYVSSAVRPFTSEELVALLEQSRRNNEQAGITGMLLYRDGNFMQVLEGEEVDVTATHTRIARDPRHTGLITMVRGAIEQRDVAGWSMGFRDFDAPDVRALPGYSDFMNEDWRGKSMQDSPQRALRLLTTFRASIR